MSDKQVGLFFIIGFVLLSLIIVWFYVGQPQYNVWEQHLAGKAELARAEYNRQISVQEAIAKREAAKSLAEAEVERAKGVAQANKIIGDSLKGNEDYLRYLWIAGLEHNTNGQIIYVPTEAGLPILEANRFSKLPAEKVGK